MQDTVYISGNVTGFNCHIRVGEKDVRRIVFVNGQFKTQDEQLIAALDDHIKKTAIGRFVRKVDENAALRWLAEQNLLPTAIQGGTTALSQRMLMQNAISQRDAALKAAAERNPKIDSELAESIALTEETGLGKTATLPLQTGAPGATESDDTPLQVEIVKPPAKLSLGNK